MSDSELETYLLASKPSNKQSLFTQGVLDTIRKGDHNHNLSYEKVALWQRISSFVIQSRLRKVTLFGLLTVATAFIGLSGYAYANNTNPFSLIKRWVTGNEVRITYQDPKTKKEREFSHGTKRSYSDLAVSAFAEVSLIDLLHFHATNAYTVPKGGIEYISDPFRIAHTLPRVGTVEQVNAESVVIHLTYSMSRSKMEQSFDIDQRITVPRTHFYYYQQGKLMPIQPDSVGTLVEVFQDEYLQHRQHSGRRPTPVDMFSVFTLSHPIDAIKESTATTPEVQVKTEHELNESISRYGFHELNVGAWAATCLNNGADTCPRAFKSEEGQNFFDSNITPSAHGSSHRNPDLIPYGEAIDGHSVETQQYQLRHIEGIITALNGDKITLKTSSGTPWTFQYSVVNQQVFAKLYGDPLKIGQHLAGGVIASVYDWDRHNFDAQYVYGMSRYN